MARHPGDWKLTYLPDGRIATAYGGAIEMRAGGGQAVPQKDPAALALRFFDTEKKFFAPSLKVENLRVAQIDQSLTGTHVRLQQVQQGYVVDNAFFEVHFNSEHQVFQISNSLVNSSIFQPPILSADDATYLAHEFLASGSDVLLSPRKSQKPRSQLRSEVLKKLEAARSTDREKIDMPLAGPVELVLYAVGNSLRPAWKMTVLQAPDKHMRLYVDAVTGEVVASTNLVRSNQ